MLIQCDDILRTTKRRNKNDSDQGEGMDIHLIQQT